jgi:hypothetical protein
MKTINTAAAGAETRDTPPLPGGGSWTFDPVKWIWVSNDPVPAAEQSPAPAVGTVTTNTEQEQLS